MISKRIFSLFLFLSLVGNVFAQKSVPAKYTYLVEKVDSVLDFYIRYSPFIDENTNKLDSKVIEKFKDLFVPGALLIDEICPAYFNGDYSNPNKLLYKTIEIYCNQLPTIFPDGLSIGIISSKKYLDNIGKNKVSITLEKAIEGRTRNGLIIENLDTIQIDLIIMEDYYQTVKIAGIKLIGNSLTLSNDYDKDFIPDNIDNCPMIMSLGKNNGCPTDEKTLVVEEPKWFFTLNFFAGRLLNDITFEDNLESTYINSFDFSTNQNSKPKITQLNTFGLEVGLEKFFGKKSHIGLGTGLQLQYLRGAVEKSSFNVSYKAYDKWNNEYKQIISVSNNEIIEEKFFVTQLGIPILLKFEGKLSKKIGFQLDAGYFYLINFTGKANLSANSKFDYEAVYFTEDGGSRYSYRAIDDPSNSWMITKSQVNLTNPGKEGEYFNLLQSEGYNVGLGETTNPDLTDKKFSFNGSSGFIIRPSFNFLAGKKTVLTFGVLLMQNTYKNNKNTESYYITKKVGEYNSLMNSLAQIKTTSILFNFGIKFRL